MFLRMLLRPQQVAFQRVLPSHGLDGWRELVPMTTRLVQEGRHMKELLPPIAQGDKQYNGAPLIVQTPPA